MTMFKVLTHFNVSRMQPMNMRDRTRDNKINSLINKEGIFQQGIVNVSYKAAMTSFRFLLVIIVVTAIVIAEFFINSSFQGLSAGKTASDFSSCRHCKGFNPLR